jgi:hypothetical protein
MGVKYLVAGVDVERLCPKKMLNGPCGGMKKGMCEVSGPCVWVKIYAKLKSAGRLGEFNVVRVPKLK